MRPPFRRATILPSDSGGVSHGFFSRFGGVSSHPYDSLNAAQGSADTPHSVEENRERCRRALSADRLVTGKQTHSSAAHFIEGGGGAPSSVSSAPECDALVTDQPGLAIGVLTADCTPILISGQRHVAAIHAGWKGSLSGIVENTIDLLAQRGEDPAHLRAAIGPCLRAPAFEVQQDLIDLVLARHPDAADYFTPGPANDKFIYDHVGFVGDRLRAAGVAANHIEDVGGCTLTHPETWFSYRFCRSTDAPDYGRNLSAIALVRA